MNRRNFLKALGAIGAGIALRPIPVLGEQYSVLEPPMQVASVAVPRPPVIIMGGEISLDKFAVLTRVRGGSAALEAQIIRMFANPTPLLDALTFTETEPLPSMGWRSVVAS